jgi:hypothetical protein
MPNRILREAIITSRAVSGLSDSGQLFFRCLMSVVDDYGRFEADLDLLRARCFPRQLDRWPLSRVSKALAECGEARSSDGAPLLSVYRVDDSEKEYCQINNFGQRIRENSTSRYPNPPVIDSTTRRNAAERGGKSPKSESESESYAETKTEAEAAPMPPLQTQSEYPLTLAYLRERDPATDPMFVLRLVQETTQKLLSIGEPGWPAERIEKATADCWMKHACKKSMDTWAGKSAHGNGLLLSRVPNILVTLGEQR